MMRTGLHLGLLCTLWAVGSSLRAAEEPTLPTEPRFGRHVVPLFSRFGCNAGACHGAVKGQNGFRLTLFGADPALDHLRVVREFGGRRLNLQDPDASLLLLKATGQIPHEGGKRLDVASAEYRLLRKWITAGALLDRPESSASPRLSVIPASQTIKRGDRIRLQVKAAFPDQSTEDVTAFCSFESRDSSVAPVDNLGQVQALDVGDTIVIARYRGDPVMAQILIPAEPKGDFPAIKEHNFIDRHVVAKLRHLNIHPADLCDDVTFLRRVSLDVTGALPTPAEIRSFLTDKTPDKRAKKIDEYLNRPGYAALWATKFSDILRPSQFDVKNGLNENASARRSYEWVRARLQENVPYDQLTERILLATSTEGRPAAEWVQEVQGCLAEDAAKLSDLRAYEKRRTLDLYWQRPSAAGVKGTLQIAHAFLGLRMECAQCHRHPFDVWQQDDLLSFTNFFMPIGGSPASPEIAKQADALTVQAKQLREQVKKLTEKAKDKSLSKEDAAKLKDEIKSNNDKAQVLDSTAKRLKGTEVRVLAKAPFASVSSTLGNQKSEAFRLLGDKQSLTVPAGEDPRAVVMAWLRRPDNPYFARAMANRVWAHYFGRGIIDPPDHLSPFNPATHPELLAELSADFIKNGYDLKKLHRLILNSRTYQQSAKTNATSKHDTANYASFYLRRLPAEVLVDAVNHATLRKETYPPELFVPPNALAVEVAGSVGNDQKKATLHYAFHIFGRPLRNPDVQCDCERDATVTVVQALFLANHPTIQAKIAAPEGRVARIAKEQPDAKKAIEELYLWTLSRTPSESEVQACIGYMKASPSHQRGLEDVMWSLLNTREFQLNH
ncbi:MAG: DUF1553 domain-containing protein [Planctomycetes bacterium]|nr:DUF1553 domain-containing protein [Planctomycetota bacterium]